jgi:hypothetical protein
MKKYYWVFPLVFILSSFVTDLKSQNKAKISSADIYHKIEKLKCTCKCTLPRCTPG